MSFLKISDPTKRDLIVKEYLELKKIFGIICSVREPENNNYRPIFQRFLNQLPKRKKLLRERLWKKLSLLKKALRTYHRLLHFQHINIVVEDEEYEGIPGLWELIVSKNPTDYTDDDYDNYARLMLKTNTLHRDNNPGNNYPKSSKADKWKYLLSKIWTNRGEYEGSGVVVIPSDPTCC